MQRQRRSKNKQTGGRRPKTYKDFEKDLLPGLQEQRKKESLVVRLRCTRESAETEVHSVAQLEQWLRTWGQSRNALLAASVKVSLVNQVLSKECAFARAYGAEMEALRRTCLEEYRRSRNPRYIDWVSDLNGPACL